VVLIGGDRGPGRRWRRCGGVSGDQLYKVREGEDEWIRANLEYGLRGLGGS
jgi:hypothetical protein